MTGYHEVPRRVWPVIGWTLLFVALTTAIYHVNAWADERKADRVRDDVYEHNLVIPTPTTIDGIPLVLETEGEIGTCSISITRDTIEEFRCADEREAK